MATILRICDVAPLSEDVFLMAAFCVAFVLWDRFKSVPVKRRSAIALETHALKKSALKNEELKSGGCASPLLTPELGLSTEPQLRTQTVQKEPDTSGGLAEASTEATNSEASSSEASSFGKAEIPSCSVKGEMQEGDGLWISMPEHYDAPFMERKMIKLLEAKNFRHALNLFRFLRRAVGIQDFTEKLFLPFVLSSIRVGKFDVVEYMMGAMLEVPHVSTPSTHFWKSTLRLLHARNQFEVTLRARDLFGAKIPSDNTVNWYIQRAEMGMKVPEQSRKVFRPLKQNGTVPKAPRKVDKTAPEAAHSAERGGLGQL